jgi:hypothetical protein
MVEYSCSICHEKKDSLEEAIECEKTQILEPFNPGLVLKSKKSGLWEEGYLIITAKSKNVTPQTHERSYTVVQIKEIAKPLRKFLGQPEYKYREVSIRILDATDLQDYLKCSLEYMTEQEFSSRRQIFEKSSEDWPGLVLTHQ